jgi:hypothetical protein
MWHIINKIKEKEFFLCSGVAVLLISSVNNRYVTALNEHQGK